MFTDGDVAVKLAVYRHFAETGRRPTPSEVAARAGATAGDVVEAYQRLRSRAAARAYRRPQPAEMRAIFAVLGLTGPFWDPEHDPD